MNLIGTFDPPELRERLSKAIKEYVDSQTLHVDLKPTRDGFALTSDDDAVVTESSDLTLIIPDADVVDIPIREYLRIAEDLPQTTLVDRVECRSPTCTLVRVEPASEAAHKFHYYFEGGEAFDRVFSTSQEVNGSNISLSIISGFSVFALKIIESNEYDKHFPPYSQTDMFVEIFHPPNQPAELISNALQAYLFELSSTLDLEFHRSPRPTVDYNWPGDEEENYLEKLEQTARLRPLLFGPGLGESESLYLKAVCSPGAEGQLLGLYRVLEYISATVVKMQTNTEIRRRLLSPRALDPSAIFISELLQLIEDHRAFRKDAESLRLTMEVCCDAVELASLSPAFLKSLREIKQSSPEADKKKSLGRIAACLTATRNMLSHAKSNYTPTGEECPGEQLPELVSCVKIAAQQAVRWFASTDITMRVI